MVVEFKYILIGIVVLLLAFSFVTVQQGTIAVVTMFGKYRRIMMPGLNFRIPFLERINNRVSIQNRAIEMEFQAITQDQANVYFKAMLVFCSAIRKVTFSFSFKSLTMLKTSSTI